MAIDKKGTKQIADNRKARHDYFVLEQIECGIELVGTEVKSIRNGGVNLKDSWCSIEDGEMWVKGMHISPYEHGNIFNRDPRRERKLLLHKREILRLFGKVQQEGLTLIPMSLYFKGSRVKLALGLCKEHLLCRACFKVGFAKVKSFMTSVTTWQRKPHSVT